MPNDPACRAPCGAPEVRTGSRCGHAVPVSAVPVVVVPVAPVPAPAGLPVLSVSGVRPDASGDVDIGEAVRDMTSAKADLVGGKVPASQLPSYVDDVLEVAELPQAGESGKLYVVTGTNAVYRWSGSSFVEVSPSRDWSGELAAKRGLTDFSVGDGWLLVKPDGTLVWMVGRGTDPDTWDGDDELEPYLNRDTGPLGEAWIFKIGPQASGERARLEIPYSEVPVDSAVIVVNLEASTYFDGVYRLVRGSRLALDTEVGKASWDNVTGKPEFATVATSGLYNDLGGKPALATVATSGSYADLTNKPIIPSPPLPGSADPQMDGTANAGSEAAYSRADHVHPTDTSRQAALSNQQLANIAAIPGKADAADLRYRIADAGFKYEFAASAFPITYMNTIVSTAVTITAGDAGDITWNVQPDGGAYVSYNGFDFAYFSSTGDYGGSQAGVDLQFNGVAAANAGEPLVQILADRAVNIIAATDETSIDIELPAAVTVDGVRYCRDFILDVDNSANANDLALEFTALGVSYAFVPLEDDSISEMMTIGAGERVRLYFTETPYTATGSLPVINVARVTLGDFVTSTTPATQGGN